MRFLPRLVSAVTSGLAAFVCLFAAGCAGGDDVFVPPTCENGCIVAPVSVCDGSSRVSFTIPGECSDEGLCEFEATTSACVFGCQAGECLPDPCQDVVCGVRPSPRCEEDIQVRFSLGTCQQGTCVYPESRFDCASNGQFCDAGACVDIDPCEEVDCSTAPAPACTADARSVVRFSAGSCSSGQCTYAQSLEECDGDGERCVDGACLPDPACASVDCTTPPDNVCDNGRAVSFSNGRCVAGGCEFNREEENCRADSAICIDGACVPEPCSLTDCDDERVDTCDGNVAVDFSGDSECRNDVCIYEAVRTDCTLRNETCQAGRCVNLCEGVACASPPPDRCDGNVATDFASGGTCAAGTCSYTSVVTDCDTFGLQCVNGRCLDECGAVVCDQTEPDVCESDVLINLGVTPGTCDEGNCAYRRDVRLCGDGSVCRDGQCVTVIACSDEEPCAAFEDFCLGNTAVTYDAQPSCEDGLCSLETGRTETDCSTLGATCQSGVCVPATRCDGVDCSLSPSGFCRGLIAVNYESPGECVGGACEFVEITTNCGLTDSVCEAGACVPSNLCDFVVCDTVPPSVCDDGVTVRQFTTPGTCDSSTGRCGTGSGFSLVPCESGTVCVAGLCVAEVEPGDVVITELFASGSLLFPNWQWVEVKNVSDRPVTVRTLELKSGTGATRMFTDGRVLAPGGYQLLASARGEFAAGLAALWSPASSLLSSPEGRVELWIGDTVVDVVDYGRPGWPLFVSGSLAVRNSNTTATENDEPGAWCASADSFASGLRGSPGVANSTCVPDLCEGVECSAARPAECRGTDRVAFVSAGVCVAGNCVFATEITDCSANGDICLDGECVPDPCAAVSCDLPDPAFCEDTVAVGFLETGRCDRGECLYDEVRRDCSDDGRSCINGECIDLCSEVVCINPDVSTCEENVAIFNETNGVCAFGECSYDQTSQDCTLAGLLCVGGACVDPCDGVDCFEPPLAFCDGSEAVQYDEAGVCTSGECDYAEVRANCEETGLVCQDGSCIDACEGVVCEQSTEPFCEGDLAVVEESVGICNQGECIYKRSERDCAQQGLLCNSGQCVDPCEGVVCDLPPASYCEGDVSVTFDDVGTCEAGECVYLPFIFDCSQEDAFCFEGACEFPAR